MLGSLDDKNTAIIAGLCLISGHTCRDDVAKFDFSPLILFLHHKVLQMKLTSFSDLLKPDTLQKIVEMQEQNQWRKIKYRNVIPACMSGY